MGCDPDAAAVAAVDSITPPSWSTRAANRQAEGTMRSDMASQFNLVRFGVFSGADKRCRIPPHDTACDAVCDTACDTECDTERDTVARHRDVL